MWIGFLSISDKQNTNKLPTRSSRNEQNPIQKGRDQQTQMKEPYCNWPSTGDRRN